MVNDCIVRLDAAYLADFMKDLLAPAVVVGVLLGCIDDGAGLIETSLFMVLVLWRACLEAELVSKILGGFAAFDGSTCSKTRAERP